LGQEAIRTLVFDGAAVRNPAKSSLAAQGFFSSHPILVEAAHSSQISPPPKSSAGNHELPDVLPARFARGSPLTLGELPSETLKKSAKRLIS
jgi:hypothetical protein